MALNSIQTVVIQVHLIIIIIYCMYLFANIFYVISNRFLLPILWDVVMGVASRTATDLDFICLSFLIMSARNIEFVSLSLSL